MIATVILGLCITGVMSMLGSGRDLETEAELRRQARIIAQNTLEEATFNTEEYPLATTLSKSVGVPLIVDAGHPVSATLTVTVGSEANEALMDGGLYYQSVTARVAWPSAAPTDFVELRKRVADTR